MPLTTESSLKPQMHFLKICFVLYYMIKTEPGCGELDYHTYNPCTQEGEAGGLTLVNTVSSRLAWRIK